MGPCSVVRVGRHRKYDWERDQLVLYEDTAVLGIPSDAVKWVKILSIILLLIWMLLSEMRFMFLYRCADNSGEQFLLQKDINDEMFGRFGELRKKWEIDSE